MTPDVRVLRGEPDDVELAALVAGLAAGASANAAAAAVADLDESATAARRRWRAAATRHRTPHPHVALVPRDPDAWRYSLR
ncbi:acyl-CoA carboxylase epsilon subunit [Isoptericola sp. b441]|uniref:Acyl-CoA carboxylase epsilon subunit n=1 Tax=Actinotalea lenta TaxID=3064654 RepID=A0ABT9D9X7_9CELL|nr:acyl-CoA carboxylase epsilon subunit [Isoptericola sp. b441]MDO8106928.1 acyl-CoA carboxylase epsilon subunit [Isoptericola sp. b441]